MENMDLEQIEDPCVEHRIQDYNGEIRCKVVNMGLGWRMWI